VGEFKSAPPDSFDWERLFRLQMAYLLLWTAIERYCSLAYGPGLEPSKKIIKLAEDKLFEKILREIIERKAIIYDSRDPKDKYELDVDDISSTIQYYYAVRSNLSHRGKGAWKDGEIIRLSLRELLNIFKLFLNKKFQYN